MNRLFLLACCAIASMAVPLDAINHMNDMRKFAMMFTLIILIFIPVFGVNNMPIMQTFIGAYGDAWYGDGLVAMDFNADSFDDLIVYSRKTCPNATSGLMIYLGGTEMDTIPDFSTSGQFAGEISNLSLLNAGDVNGDGYDDLLNLARFPYDGPLDPPDSCALRFYWGGPDADLVCDHEIITEYYNEDIQVLPTSSIGDVNNDGFDDLACLLFNQSDHRYGIALLLGEIWDIIVLQEHLHGLQIPRINGVGDVNGDGIDDFVAGYALDTEQGRTAYRHLYYGNDPLDLSNYIQLAEIADGGATEFPGSYGIGDFNSDGYEDFVYCNGDSYLNNNKLRLGGSDITNTSELTVSPHPAYNLLDMERRGIAYGDFNGDGFSDLAGADYEVGTWTGNAGVWLGKANPNGIYDLRIPPPPTSPFHQFGWQLESGDFNGDGFCDLAISSPNPLDGDPFYRGYVYIFAGNPDLTDTTVANEDELAPQLTDKWSFSTFPNPLPAGKAVTLRYQGKGYEHLNTKTISLYNLKGQRVYQMQDSSRGEISNIQLPELPSGVYIIKVSTDGHRHSSKRIVVY